MLGKKRIQKSNAGESCVLGKRVICLSRNLVKARRGMHAWVLVMPTESSEKASSLPLLNQFMCELDYNCACCPGLETRLVLYRAARPPCCLDNECVGRCTLSPQLERLRSEEDLRRADYTCIELLLVPTPFARS